MMKKTIAFLSVLSFGLVYSQSTDGKVGINTEAPDATLLVKSLNGSKVSDATNVANNKNLDKNLELQNSSSEKLVTVLNNGAVGIGNETPQYMLDVTALSDDYFKSSIVFRNFRNQAYPGALNFYRARGQAKVIENGKVNPTKTTVTPVQSGDVLMMIGNYAYTRSNQKLSDTPTQVFAIRTTARGTINANPKQPVPTSLEFCRINSQPTGSESVYNSVLAITPDDKVGIGYLNYSSNPNTLKSTLDVNGDIRSDSLKGQGIRNVVADADGVLKIGSAVSTEVKATAPTTDKVCDKDTVGSIFYKNMKDANNKEVGVFGFCTKNGNDYVWGYMVGGSNVYGTSASGAKFGDGTGLTN